MSFLQRASQSDPPGLSAAQGRALPRSVLLGDPGSGKSSLYQRLTLGESGGALLYDTCKYGAVQPKSLNARLLPGSRLRILVADASNLHSVRSLDHWNVDAGCYAPHGELET
uniref:Signal recognition particle receptor subunit beta n=1 Tax=Macrostomum lignano TaxID=282301 RepID=A0A1I8H8C5_9PLAT